MKLGSKEIQKTPEKRMWRQRESAVDVSGEKDTVTLLRLRLSLVLRKLPGVVGNQSPLHQILQVLLPDRRPNPVALDPAGRQAIPRRRSTPAGPLPFRLRRRLLRTLQCHRLLLPHRGEQSSNGAAALGQEQMQQRKLGGKEKNEDALFKENPGPTTYMGPLPSG